MNRKKGLKPKARVKLAIDSDLLEALNKDGVNKSRLFSISARLYLRRKGREKFQNEQENIT